VSRQGLAAPVPCAASRQPLEGCRVLISPLGLIFGLPRHPGSNDPSSHHVTKTPWSRQHGASGATDPPCDSFAARAPQPSAASPARRTTGRARRAGESIIALMQQLSPRSSRDQGATTAASSRPARSAVVDVHQSRRARRPRHREPLNAAHVPRAAPASSPASPAGEALHREARGPRCRATPPRQNRRAAPASRLAIGREALDAPCRCAGANAGGAIGREARDAGAVAERRPHQGRP